jgi:DNA-binding GntR family transcriptional regulator
VKNGVDNNTLYQFYTMEHMHDALDNKNATINALKLRSLNVGRALARSSTTISEHKRLITAISTRSVQRVDKLVAVAVRNRVGISEMIRRIDHVLRSNDTVISKSFSRLLYLI